MDTPNHAHNLCAQFIDTISPSDQYPCPELYGYYCPEHHYPEFYEFYSPDFISTPLPPPLHPPEPSHTMNLAQEILGFPTSDGWEYIILSLTSILAEHPSLHRSHPSLHHLLKRMINFMDDIEDEAEHHRGGLGTRKFEFLTGVLMNIDERGGEEDGGGGGGEGDGEGKEENMLARRVLRFMFDESVVDEEVGWRFAFTRLERDMRGEGGERERNREGLRGDGDEWVRISAAPAHGDTRHQRGAEHREHRRLESPRRDSRADAERRQQYHREPERSDRRESQGRAPVHQDVTPRDSRNAPHQATGQHGNRNAVDYRPVNTRPASSGLPHRPRTAVPHQSDRRNSRDRGSRDDMDLVTVRHNRHPPRSALREPNKDEKPKEVRFNLVKEARSERGGIYEALVVDNEGKTEELKEERRRRRRRDRRD